jgi:hypothetical protein
MMLMSIVGSDINSLSTVVVQYEKDLEDYLSRDTYSPVRIASSLSESNRYI